MTCFSFIDAIALEALRQVIAANNSNDGAGRLDEGGESLLVREEGRIRTPDDLRAIVVAVWVAVGVGVFVAVAVAV